MLEHFFVFAWEFSIHKNSFTQCMAGLHSIYVLGMKIVRNKTLWFISYLTEFN